MPIPAYLDMARLCQELSLSERTIEAYVAQGLLPPPKRLGKTGKRLWKWSEVERYIDAPADDHPTDAERIRHATQRTFTAET